MQCWERSQKCLKCSVNRVPRVSSSQRFIEQIVTNKREAKHRKQEARHRRYIEGQLEFDPHSTSSISPRLSLQCSRRVKISVETGKATGLGGQMTSNIGASGREQKEDKSGSKASSGLGEEFWRVIAK